MQCAVGGVAPLDDRGLVCAAAAPNAATGLAGLPAGEHGNVITFTPPFTITQKQLERAMRALQFVLR